MPDEHEPFYFLKKSLNILLIDDDPHILKLICDILSPVKIFSIKVANTAVQAEQILSSSDRTHLCVSDLGISDIKGDEYYLLKTYGSRVSFCILTGSDSPAKGYEVSKLGASAIIEKSSQFDKMKFIKTVNRYILLNVINPKYGRTKDTLAYSTDILFDMSPNYVSQWSIQTGITDRELRHIWSKNLGANAKIILSTYHMFSNAMNYFEQVVASDGSSDSAKIKNLSDYKRLEEYFHMHRSTILDFIAYGDIANIL